MGKGQIIANLGDGEYTVKVLYNRTRLNAMISRLTDQIAAAQTLITDYNAQLTSLEEELTAINARLQVLAGELSNLEGQLSILNGELRALQDLLKGYQNEIAALETQIADTENSIAGLNGQIDDAEAEIDELELQAAALQAEIDALPDGPEKTAKQAELDAVNLQIADLEAAILGYQSSIGSLNSQIDLWELEITGIEDNDIAPQNVEISAKEKQVSDKQTEVDEKKAAIEVVQDDKRTTQNDITREQALIDGKNLYIAGLEKRKEVLQALPDDPVVGAWCADLTDDLTGDVATIEPYGEYNYERTLIRPGYADRHIWDADRDGQLQFIKAMTPAQAFYNLAMLPGWQTWMPTYRIGTITSIDHNANTCNLTIETVRSSQQRLVISGWPTLTGVPFEYMTCNSAAFVVGDKVVVEYRNRSASEDETPYVIGFESEPKPCESFGKMTFNGFDFQPDNYYIFVLKIEDTDGTVGIIACDTEGKFRFPEGFSSASTLSLWYVGGYPGVYRGWAFEDMDDWLVTGGTATANGDGTCTLSESTTLYQGVTLASRSMVINWIYIRALIVHEVTGTLTVSTPSGNISITAPGAYAIPVCYEIYGETGAVNHNFMCYTSAGGSAKISHPMQWFSGKRWNFANLSDNSVNQLFDGADFVDHTPEDVSGYSGYTADAFQYYIEQPGGGYDEANGISRYQKTTYPFQFAIHGANSELSGDEAWTITLKRCRQLLLNTPISGLTTATIDFFGQTVTAKLAIMPVKKIRQQRTYHSYGSGCFCINGVSWNCTEELEAWTEGSLIPYRYFGMSGQLPEYWYCSGVKWIRVESGSPPTFYSDLGSADDETIGKYSCAIMVTNDDGANPTYTNAEAHLLYDQNIFSTATEQWILEHEGEPVPLYPAQNVADFDVYEWIMIDANGALDHTPT